jgi:hypothetical protein
VDFPAPTWKFFAATVFERELVFDVDGLNSRPQPARELHIGHS